MLVRKKALLLITIVSLILFYFTFSDKVVESNEFSTESQTKVVEHSDELLVNKPLLVNEKELKTKWREHEKVIDDLGFFECVPDFLLDEQAYTLTTEQYLHSLSGSSSNTESLYYSLYAPPPEGKHRIDLLFDYYNHFPNNHILAMDLISACINSDDKRCTAGLIKSVVDAESNNGAIWLSAISFYGAMENTAEVLNAIDGLKKASIFNEKYGERILLYTQALEGSPSNNFNINAVAGIGKAAAAAIAYYPITKWCERGLNEFEVANACMTLGEELETRSKTLINKTIGIALQEMVFKSQKDTVGIQAIEKRKKS